MKRAGLTRICGHSFLGGLLPPGSLVFDLGANRGEFAREISQRFACRVHAVEPAPELAADLRTDRRLNVIEAALSAHGGRAFLEVSEDAEASHLGGPNPTGGRCVVVRAVTLGQALGGTEGPIDLVKMDIEGAELEVLESAADATIQRIRQLTVEFHQFLNPLLRTRIEAVKRRLHKLGFWSLDFSRCNYDVLFVRRELGIHPLVRLRLAAHKYGAGLARRLGSGALARYWTGAASTARSAVP